MVCQVVCCADWQEKVAELELSTYGYTLARRDDGGRVFVNESRGSRYYVEEMVVQAIAGHSNIQACYHHRPEILSLLWSPYGIGQTIIFSSCFFLLFLFPGLITVVGD